MNNFGWAANFLCFSNGSSGWKWIGLNKITWFYPRGKSTQDGIQINLTFEHFFLLWLGDLVAQKFKIIKGVLLRTRLLGFILAANPLEMEFKSVQWGKVILLQLEKMVDI